MSYYDEGLAEEYAEKAYEGGLKDGARDERVRIVYALRADGRPVLRMVADLIEKGL